MSHHFPFWHMSSPQSTITYNKLLFPWLVCHLSQLPTLSLFLCQSCLTCICHWCHSSLCHCSFRHRSTQSKYHSPPLDLVRRILDSASEVHLALLRNGEWGVVPTTRLLQPTIYTYDTLDDKSCTTQRPSHLRLSPTPNRQRSPSGYGTGNASCSKWVDVGKRGQHLLPCPAHFPQRSISAPSSPLNKSTNHLTPHHKNLHCFHSGTTAMTTRVTVVQWAPQSDTCLRHVPTSTVIPTSTAVSQLKVIMAMLNSWWLLSQVCCVVLDWLDIVLYFVFDVLL